jgi:hypothetical protein
MVNGTDHVIHSAIVEKVSTGNCGIPEHDFHTTDRLPFGTYFWKKILLVPPKILLGPIL